MAKMTAEEIEREVERIAFRCKYEGYLKSKKWWMKRRQKLFEKNFTCERCGKSGFDEWDYTIDVHHKTYEHLGDEPLEDLEVLCRACHIKHHGH